MASILGPEDFLVRGGSLTSPGGSCTLYLQDDGNLVLRKRGGAVLWATNTTGRAINRAVMQSDGNFVMYGFPDVVWSTGTGDRPGSFLIVQDDGKVMIYQPNAPVWSSDG